MSDDFFDPPVFVHIDSSRFVEMIHNGTLICTSTSVSCALYGVTRPAWERVTMQGQIPLICGDRTLVQGLFDKGYKTLVVLLTPGSEKIWRDEYDTIAEVEEISEAQFRSYWTEQAVKLTTIQDMEVTIREDDPEPIAELAGAIDTTFPSMDSAPDRQPPSQSPVAPASDRLEDWLGPGDSIERSDPAARIAHAAVRTNPWGVEATWVRPRPWDTARPFPIPIPSRPAPLHVALPQGIGRDRRCSWNRDCLGRLPLHEAARLGHLDRLRAILLAQPLVGAITPSRRTALHFAATSGSVDAATALLKAGADPNAADRFGQTALHLATRAGDLAMIQRLLHAHANPLAQNAEGKTPADLARALGLDDTLQVLLDNERAARERQHAETERREELAN